MAQQFLNNSVSLFAIYGNGDLISKGGLATGAETAPDVDPGGICLQQNAGTGTIISGKSSSVSHPFTAYESDSYFRVGKINSSAGGAEIVGFSSSANGARMIGFAGTPNTTGAGVVRFDAIKHAGSGTPGPLAANEQAFTFYSSGTLLATIKGNGNILNAGSIATGNELAPDVDLGGICINTGTADLNAFTTKNADVAHPFTGTFETDTFFAIRKADSNLGGAAAYGISEGALGLYFGGYAVTPSSTLNTYGVIAFEARKSDGAAGSAALSDAENLATFSSQSSRKVIIKGNGTIHTFGSLATGGEDAPDVDLGGLCLNQAGGDLNILTLKSSDVAHPFTAIAETDSYAFFRKAGATTGGVSLVGFSSGSGLAAYIGGYMQTPTTAAGGVAAVTLDAAKTNGTTGSAALAATENLLNVTNRGTVIFTIKGNGDVIAAGTLTGAGVSTSSISNGTSSVSIPVASADILHTTAGAERLRILTAGQISTGGESLPDVDPGGICINTGAADGNALTLKNSDVAHPFTAQAETDTYAQFGKVIAAEGGLRIRGFAEAATPGLYLQARTQTPATALGNNAPITLLAIKSNGATGDSSLGASDNLYCLLNGSTYIHQITGAGNQFVFGGIATGNELAPDVDLGGICINTGTADNNAMTLKNADVAHGMTVVAETDTYAWLRKYNATQGGLSLAGLSSGARALALYGILTTETTTWGTEGAVTLQGSTKSTTTHAAMSDAANMVVFLNLGVAKAIIKGNGTFITQASLSTGGETAPDIDQGGLTLNQGSGSGNIFTLKSSSVVHGLTTRAEDDTYFAMRKYHATNGGAMIRGYSASSVGLFINSEAATASTSNTTASGVVIDSRKGSGTTTVALAATENLVTFCTDTAVKALIKGNGDFFTLGSIATGGEAAPDATAGGLTLQQNAAIGPIQTFKSTNVAQPFTTNAELDTFGSFLRVNNANGGLNIRGFTAGTTSAVDIAAFQQTGVAAGPGTLNMTAYKSNGTTGVASLAATENLLTVYNGSTLVFTIKGNGDVVAAGAIGGAGSAASISNGTSSVGVPTVNAEVLVTTAGTERLRIGATGILSTGAENAPDADPGGLTLHHGTADNYVMTFKNGDVAHGFTTNAETDTYAQFMKANSTQGGLSIRGFAEASGVGVQINGYSETPGVNTVGAIQLRAHKLNGSAAGSVAATEDAITMSNNGAELIRIKGDGITVHAGTVCGSLGSISPTTGGSTTVADNIQNYLLSHGATIASYTITLPVGRYDGQEFTLCARNVVTTLTMNAQSSQTLLGGLTTIAANGFATWVYSASLTTWYRKG